MNPSTEEQLLWRGPSSQLVNFWTFVICGLLFFLIVPLFIALWKWLQVRCRIYEVTNEWVKISQGVFSRQTDELELYRVTDTKLVELFWYRIFGKGNVVLLTTDTTTPTLTIECIPQAKDLREKIRKSIEVYRDRKRVRLTELGGDVDLEPNA